MQSPFSSAYDAIVVGSRCAGAATAMLLARRGLRVLNVDRAAYGSDTMSTLALMRGGVMQLARWGVLDDVRAAGTPPSRVTTFHYGDRAVPVAIDERDGVDALYAPRRTLLDALLADAARDAGAEVRHRVRLTGLTRDTDGRVTGALLSADGGDAVEVKASIVIGADGRKSTVARLVGARPYWIGRHAASYAYAYWSGLALPPGTHWFFRPGVMAGAIPTDGGRHNVFVSTSPLRFAEDLEGEVAAGYRRAAFEASPVLGDLLCGARREGAFVSYRGEVGFLRRSYGAGWALVGDAGYYKDPFTAHGMTDALRDAELLANAVARGTAGALADYQARRDALSLDMAEVTDRLASFAWDLEQVGVLHRAASRAMKAEVESIRRFELGERAA